MFTCVCVYVCYLEKDHIKLETKTTLFIPCLHSRVVKMAYQGDLRETCVTQEASQTAVETGPWCLHLGTEGQWGRIGDCPAPAQPELRLTSSSPHDGHGHSALPAGVHKHHAPSLCSGDCPPDPAGLWEGHVSSAWTRKGQHGQQQGHLGCQSQVSAQGKMSDERRS